MSFQVSIERIERIWPHPNADRLEITALAGKGYQLIVPRVGRCRYKEAA